MERFSSKFTQLLAGHSSSWVAGPRASAPGNLLTRDYSQILSTWGSPKLQFIASKNSNQGDKRQGGRYNLCNLGTEVTIKCCCIAPVRRSSSGEGAYTRPQIPEGGDS